MFVVFRASAIILLLLICLGAATDISMHPLGSELLSDSIELAVGSCRRQFRWDRWNCPTMQFLTKRSPSSMLDREAAFVRAISMASMIYVFARNCSQGSNSGACGCERCEREAQSLETGFVEHHRLDAKGYGNAHNRRAGWVAVQNAVRGHCRCHGVSGSCAMRTCWNTMKTFGEIASGVKRMYSEGVRLYVDNSGKLNTEKIREDQLAYIHPSPNYCQKDVIAGWPGMVNRECSMERGMRIATDERKSCRNLCRKCGLKVRKQTKVENRKCNCRFSWCCRVVCDNCLERVEEYRCQ